MDRLVNNVKTPKGYRSRIASAKTKNSHKKATCDKRKKSEYSPSECE